jgi:kynurenine formamidase
MLVDLSHTFEDGMPGFVMHAADGRSVPLTVIIRTFLTHQQSAHFYGGKASFELTEMNFQTSIGTYIDSPRHRFANMRDISELSLEELVLDGFVVHVPDACAGEKIGLERVHLPDDIAGKAVLFRFEWDRYWGQPAYDSYPYIGRDVIAHLVAGRAKLVGVDTINGDDRNDLERPFHTELLRRDILIVENLTNLGALPPSGFRFFAIPIKAKNTAAMTVRAFAEIAPS